MSKNSPMNVLRTEIISILLRMKKVRESPLLSADLHGCRIQLRHAMFTERLDFETKRRCALSLRRKDNSQSAHCLEKSARAKLLEMRIGCG